MLSAEKNVTVAALVFVKSASINVELGEEMNNLKTQNRPQNEKIIRVILSVVNKIKVRIFEK